MSYIEIAPCATTQRTKAIQRITSNISANLSHHSPRALMQNSIILGIQKAQQDSEDSGHACQGLQVNNEALNY